MSKDKNLLNNPSTEQEDYLNLLKEVGKKVEGVLKKHPNYDPADLFRIVLNSYKTPEELLAKGLRRRTIGVV